MNKFGVDEQLWQDYLDYFGTNVDEIESVEQTSYYDLIITNRDGTKEHFDNNLIAIRRLPNSWDEITREEYKTDAHVRLYLRIRRSGMTYDEISKETGISVGTLSNYVNGRTSPTIDNLYLIAKALGCRMDDLIYIE